MTLPKVSIVVCTYNGEQFLHQQLQSLVSQTYPNLEIIVSDDKSIDNTVSIVRSFQRKDRRIKLHINEENLGYNKNFENAFHLATGDFIAISDQDDIWKANKIADMMPLFEERTLLVYCQSVCFEKEVPPVEKYSKRKLFKGNDVRKLMYVNTIGGHNIIFRKELLWHSKPFPDRVFYDWWLTIIAASFGNINSTENVYTFHRLHANNVTLKKNNQKIQTKNTAREKLITVQNILEVKGLKKEQHHFGEQLYLALKTLQGKRFSLPLLFFLLRHSGIIFFFKKRPWSRVKMACRLSLALETEKSLGPGKLKDLLRARKVPLTNYHLNR